MSLPREGFCEHLADAASLRAPSAPGVALTAALWKWTEGGYLSVPLKVIPGGVASFFSMFPEPTLVPPESMGLTSIFRMN